MFKLDSTLQGNTAYKVAPADLNGDGFLDLILPNFVYNTVSVRLGDGLGGFSAATSFATGTSPMALAFGDLNGDGRLDLVVGNFHGASVSVLLGDGNGGFGVQTAFDSAGGSRSVALGDLNHDGYLDLVTANLFAGNGLSILLGDGNGAFGAATPTDVIDRVSDVKVVDLNGDGHLDLAFLKSSVGAVSISLGDGTGGFGPTTDLSLGLGGDVSSISLAAVDLNGDGHLDLAVANSLVNSITVFLSDGLGSFTAPTSFGTGVRPYTILAADMNGDGKLDLVTSNGSGSVSVLLGDGGGGFAGAVHTPAGPDGMALAIGGFQWRRATGPGRREHRRRYDPDPAQHRTDHLRGRGQPS